MSRRFCSTSFMNAASMPISVWRWHSMCRPLCVTISKFSSCRPHWTVRVWRSFWAKRRSLRARGAHIPSIFATAIANRTSALKTRWLEPFAMHWPMKPAAFLLFCRGRVRSNVQPLFSKSFCLLISFWHRFTVRWRGAIRMRQSSQLQQVIARWCWQPPLPKPPSPLMACEW